uniref:Uncharacterized protein n=1 Tax=Zea mays TaxID=4577 RepID=A0A804LVB5_MAIZE
MANRSASRVRPSATKTVEERRGRADGDRTDRVGVREAGVGCGSGCRQPEDGEGT